jgi:hypothetical protein
MLSQPLHHTRCALWCAAWENNRIMLCVSLAANYPTPFIAQAQGGVAVLARPTDFSLVTSGTWMWACAHTH